MSSRLTAACAAALASVGLLLSAPCHAAPVGPAASSAGDSVSPESLVAGLGSSPSAKPQTFGAAAFKRAAGAALATLSNGPVDPVKTTGWQCAQFARLLTGIQIFGDARTWWTQAVGKYARGQTPQAGSVLVFKPYGAMRLGHVSVVSQVLTDRIIQVTHANWSLIGGRRGQVEKDVTVVDVSPAGDWSQVKVWYDPQGDLGTTVYPTYGFVYNAIASAVTRAAVAATGGVDGGAQVASAR